MLPFVCLRLVLQDDYGEAEMQSRPVETPQCVAPRITQVYILSQPAVLPEPSHSGRGCWRSGCSDYTAIGYRVADTANYLGATSVPPSACQDVMRGHLATAAAGPQSRNIWFSYIQHVGPEIKFCDVAGAALPEWRRR